MLLVDEANTQAVAACEDFGYAKIGLIAPRVRLNAKPAVAVAVCAG